MNLRDWPRHCTSIFVLLLVGICPLVALAQDPEVLATGQNEFQQYCATCHGQQAKGDGPTAGILSVKPPNLTQLSKKNGGTFPFWEAYATIDGSNEKMQGHGSREMPLWGNRFRAERGSAEMWIHGSRGRILSLVHYLESIQVE